MSAIQLKYMGLLDTEQLLTEHMVNLSAKDQSKVAENIGVQLSTFEYMKQGEQRLVYKTFNEIAIFTKKVNKQYDLGLTIERMKTIEGLALIGASEKIHEQNYFKAFFEIDDELKFKQKVFTMKKKSGGRYNRFSCGGWGWKKSRIIVTGDGVIYYKQSSENIREFLQFGKDFKWQLAQDFFSFQLTIFASHRKILLKALNERDYLLFVYELAEKSDKFRKNLKYRFGSFAPVRKCNDVNLFVDGKDYFESLAACLESAKHEVFMCGWWISPEFLLVRSSSQKNVDYQLGNILRRIAVRGVKIYILVYFESSFLTNDSAYTKQALEGLSKNIKVIRHPDVVLPSFWSHHEKLVVVDQLIAHMGGLDVCYGRYDDACHKIDDRSAVIYPGIEYNNCRVNDFTNVRDYMRDNVPRNVPRLPWHDIALSVKGQCVKDLSRHFIEYWNYASYQVRYADRYVLTSRQEHKEKKRNFFEGLLDLAHTLSKKKHEEHHTESNNMRKKWSEDIRDVGYERSPSRNNQNSIQSEERFSTHLEVRGATQKHIKSRSQLSIREAMHREIKPQSNLFVTDPKHSNNKANRQLTPRQQRNIKLSTKKQLCGNQLAAKQQALGNKLADHQSLQNVKMNDEFNEKEIEGEWKVKQNLKQSNNYKNANISQLNGSLNDQSDKLDLILQNDRSQKQLQEMDNYQPDWLENFLSPQSQNHDDNFKNLFSMKNSQTQNCQVLRSASQWSIGCRESNYEKSICEAYIAAIKQAKKYIYIQNQFFISATKQDRSGTVKNPIMIAIADRVIKAIKNKESFRVVLFIPLIPGFAGQLDDANATLPRVIMNWQYKTLCYGQSSLRSRIMEHTKSPQDYLEIYGLRNHGIIDSIPKTQIIYIHSKLMIVDDCKLICGSANVNDRSMEGNRDSELCLFIDGDSNHQITIAGQKCGVIQKIHNLRMQLWAEHFDLSLGELIDPTDPFLIFKMKHIANKNTQIYRQVFGCYPDDNIQSLSQLKTYRKSINLELYKQKSREIQGHAVEFPLKFLQSQVLTSYHPNILST